MPRPPKFRRVGFLPDVTYFKPAGIPMRALKEVILTVEELEAIRLKDLEDLEQEACAEKMQVSRPTFQRVLEAARSKVAEALVQGKAIRVEGGHFRLAAQNPYCPNCGYELIQDPKSEGVDVNGARCPKCREPLPPDTGFPGHAGGPPGSSGPWRRGWRGGRG